MHFNSPSAAILVVYVLEGYHKHISTVVYMCKVTRSYQYLVFNTKPMNCDLFTIIQHNIRSYNEASTYIPATTHIGTYFFIFIFIFFYMPFKEEVTDLIQVSLKIFLPFIIYN